MRLSEGAFAMKMQKQKTEEEDEEERSDGRVTERAIDRVYIYLRGSMCT